MLTLDEHNRMISQMYENLRNLRRAGVACKCGSEMVYEDDQVLPTHPTKQRVRCPNCNERGYKLG